MDLLKVRDQPSEIAGFNELCKCRSTLFKPRIHASQMNSKHCSLNRVFNVFLSFFYVLG